MQNKNASPEIKAMIMLMKAVGVVYQFWLHTEAINKMPSWFEAIFNTPSHHRVHHATNVEYLDKNHAGTLIIWDKIFGTFKEEEQKPVYGLTKKINSSNPVVIAFHEWKNLFNDFKKAKNIKDYANYLFNVPGWSNDGSSKTTKQLQKELNKKKVPSYKLQYLQKHSESYSVNQQSSVIS